MSLELGGKDPVIVCDDVDVEIAARGTCWGGFVNAGQVCTSVERVYVYENVAKKFTEALVEEAKKVKIGDPMDDATDVGPMASMAQLNNAIEKVNLAKEQGCRVLTGGKRSDKYIKGYFFEPTVFDKIKDEMDIVTEESFSPIIPVQKIHSMNEAIEMANDPKKSFSEETKNALSAAAEAAKAQTEKAEKLLKKAAQFEELLNTELKVAAAIYVPPSDKK